MNLIVDNTENRIFKIQREEVVTPVIPAVDKNFHELDALSQLKANVSQLEDLHFRLNFMVREVKSLIRK